MYNKIAFWTIFAASLVLFFAPVPPLGKNVTGLDKLVHGLIFEALLYFSFLGFAKRRLPALVLLIFYGFLIEFIQGTFLPLRHFDWNDIIADMAGIIAGVVFVILGYLNRPADKSKKSEERQRNVIF